MGEPFALCAKGKRPIPLPPPDPETLFDELLQALPRETGQMAREVQALARARTVKTPAQRLRVVVWDCGVEQTWRAVAGTWPALYDPRTDQAVAERLRAGKPGGPALLRPMVPGGAALPQGWRVVVIDASRGPAPGARGTDDRLPRGLAVVSGECLEGSRTAAQTGETLQQVSWGPGDVAVAARGDAPPQGLGEAVSQGAALLVRWAAWKRQPADPIRTLPVVVRAASGQDAVTGWGPAERLRAAPAHAARRQCRQRPQKGAPQAAPRCLAGGGRGLTTRSPEVLSARTILAVSRCRWQVDRAIKRGKRGRDVDALRAKAPRPLAAVWRPGTLREALRRARRRRRPRGDPWSRLDHERVATWGRVWGLLNEAIAPMITGALCGKDEAWEAGLKGWAERPRRRK